MTLKKLQQIQLVEWGYPHNPLPNHAVKYQFDYRVAFDTREVYGTGAELAMRMAHHGRKFYICYEESDQEESLENTRCAP